MPSPENLLTELKNDVDLKQESLAAEIQAIHGDILEYMILRVAEEYHQLKELCHEQLP